MKGDINLDNKSRRKNVNPCIKEPESKRPTV